MGDQRRKATPKLRNASPEEARMNRITVGVVTALAAALVLAAPASGAPTCPKPSALPANFGGPIDNPYLPLSPGTTLSYRGKVDGKSATDVFSVTNSTKVILGVTTTVVHDQVFIKGDLAE